MTPRFLLAMAWRESRFSRRRLALTMVPIMLGVAAIVATNSFRTNVTASVRAQARALLGADLELSSRRPFAAPVRALLDSSAGAGMPVSYLTNFASMALALRSSRARLVQVRAVSGAFPYYGTIKTDPPDRWPSLGSDRRALVDPALLIQLEAEVGDTLAVGAARFVIVGVLTDVPGEADIEAAFAPRVYIPAAYLEETQLLRYGSLVRYHAYLRIDDDRAVQRFINGHLKLFRANHVAFTTVSEQEEDLTQALGALTRFLSLLGLVALLLGGIGVASATHVFIKAKLDTVAVLRCLGATAPTVFSIYLAQAALLGLGSALAGAGAGLLVQTALPDVLAGFLPLDVQVARDWPSVAAGLAMGLWVSVIFALLPLLAVRRVTPLQALRRDFAGGGTQRPGARDPLRYGAYAALGASVLLLSVGQAPRWAVGLAFAGALGTSVAALGATAWAATRAARRLFPRRARYVVRQGVANLFRPQNQTVAVTLALGFGVFLIATMYQVQRNLLDQLALDTRADRPNLVVFDIQQDQRDGVAELFRSRGVPLLQLTPIVTARIAGINGRPVDSVLADTGAMRPERWALRREYRNTYRDSLAGSERLVAGTWWRAGGRTGGQPDRRPGARSALPRMSLEEGIAQELRVGVGDRITWDVQGIRIESQVASLRRVNWARFEPNFFVVFEPGVLETAPQTYVALTRAADPLRRAEVQRDLVLRHSNVSALDLTTVLDALDRVFGKVAFAIRFMAAFTIASGIVVLIGAVVTSRLQRTRESVLLRTLGATGAQVREILVTEYLALGAIAGLTGVILAVPATWALITFFFDMEFRLALGPIAAVWLGITVLTTAVGFGLSGDVFRRTPLEALREV